MRGIADFQGGYTVSRRIEDRLTGAETTFEGTATITADGPGAIYRETGALQMGSGTFTAERSYLWRPAGARIEVAFADGQPFHDFDPEHGGQATEHLCGADMYRGGYDFSEWTCWSLRWDVSGPRKEYTSVTWYVRR
ncbi:DUF6314 family protein [Pseudooctadecabacter sp.]|uniref:DUF6314 family protein n=1 Tax=Pseudooctadecabacter sp. TaxID=1966338 RepID=UPI0025E59AD2|nr:DUF6314 family protein [Pseudooctadecabacter sp.]